MPIVAKRRKVPEENISQALDKSENDCRKAGTMTVDSSNVGETNHKSTSQTMSLQMTIC